MVFWLSILGGIVCLGIAMKIGFFEAFAGFFNVLIAIYIALFLTPALLNIVPQAADIPFGVVVTGMAVALGTFLLLSVICFFAITGQFKVPFPKIFEILFAGALGFLGGILIVSFVAVMLGGTRLNALANVTRQEDLASNTRYLCWWCDHLHRWVGSTDEDSGSPTQAAITQIWTLAQQQEDALPADPNIPAQMSRIRPKS